MVKAHRSGAEEASGQNSLGTESWEKGEPPSYSPEGPAVLEGALGWESAVPDLFSLPPASSLARARPCSPDSISPSERVALPVSPGSGERGPADAHEQQRASKTATSTADETASGKRVTRTLEGIRVKSPAAAAEPGQELALSTQGAAGRGTVVARLGSRAGLPG